MEYENQKLLVETYENGVAKVTLNNPPLNTVTLDLTREMYDTFKKLDRDERVRVIVLTGSGTRAFCAGSDIKEFPAVSADVIELKLKKENEAYNMIEQISKPVIAALEGVVYGGGCELALTCDIRIASETAKFALPEINLGVVPGTGGVMRMPKTVGLSKACEMMYLGEPISAREAKEWRLVGHVVPAGEAVKAALEMAGKIAEKSSLSLAAIKKYSREMCEETREQSFWKNLLMSDPLFKSPECKEGVEAFFAKRKPDFHKKNNV